MKKLFLIIISVFFTSFATQLNGQNRIAVTLEEFTSLYVSGSVNIELVPSRSHEMTITARNGQPEEVEYEIKNGKLKIKTRPDLKKENEISIKLPYSMLTHLTAASGALINSRQDLKSKELELKVFSGGKIELSVDAKFIDAKVTQLSDIILYGKTESQNVVANTGGNYLAYDLECEDTYAKASSGAQIKVRAKRKIKVLASTSGFIGYIGDPQISSTKTSLGGEIASYKTNPMIE